MVLSKEKNKARWSEALKPGALSLPILRMLALVGLAACGGGNTGVTQLPVPPAREVVAFTTAPPANGPPDAPTNDCNGWRFFNGRVYRQSAGDLRPG